MEMLRLPGPPGPAPLPALHSPAPPGCPRPRRNVTVTPWGGLGEGRVGAPEINVQIAVELAPSLGLFDTCGGFAAGCGGGCGAVLWKWALGGRGGDKAVGLCPWGEGKPHYSHSLPCGCWRGALPACRAAPQPLVPTGGPRPPPNPPDPLQELVGGLQVSPGWAPHSHTHTHTHGTSSFHVSLIKELRAPPPAAPAYKSWVEESRFA